MLGFVNYAQRCTGILFSTCKVGRCCFFVTISNDARVYFFLPAMFRGLVFFEVIPNDARVYFFLPAMFRGLVFLRLFQTMHGYTFFYPQGGLYFVIYSLHKGFVGMLFLPVRWGG